MASNPRTLNRHPLGAPGAGRFAPFAHALPTATLAGTADDYRVGHRAPTDDGYCASIDELTRVFPEDVYEHPEYVGSGEVDEETMAQLSKAKGNPDGTVRIYRALPPGLGEINAADWVTLSKAYAAQHAIQDDDEANDWPVIHADVPVRTVFADGNDLAEFGYDGPALAGLADS